MNRLRFIVTGRANARRAISQQQSRVRLSDGGADTDTDFPMMEFESNPPLSTVSTIAAIGDRVDVALKRAARCAMLTDWRHCR